MAEENQVQQVTTELEENQVQRVTTKNPKKVKTGRRLADYHRKKREELKAQKSEEQKSEEQKSEEQKSEEQKSEVNQYYSTGVVLAVGVIGGLGYYLYQANDVPPQQPQQRPQTNKFEME